MFRSCCRVGLFALTSQAHRSKYGISAVEWNEAVITAVGKGKGGGKPDLANANIQVDSTTGHNVADVVQKVLDAANGYVNSRKT